MKRTLSLLLAVLGIAVLTSCNTPEDKAPSAQVSANYSVSVEQAGELTVCQVTFTNVPGEASAVAKIMRNAVESLV